MGRHDRQILEFGKDGQLAIEGAKVGIIGCGGLGTNVATALTIAGVRRFVIADPDYPEESNLNRQYVYCGHIGDGRPKAEILAEWMGSLDPEADVEFHVCRFDRGTMSIMADCDVLVECLDSIEGRLEANRCAVELGKPMVHGGIDGFLGEVATIMPGRTPCLYCMMGPMSNSGRTPASIGSVVSTIGSMEATEALKLITGRCDSTGTFLSMDFEKWRFQSVRFDRDPDCPVCGGRRLRFRPSPRIRTRARGSPRRPSGSHSRRRSGPRRPASPGRRRSPNRRPTGPRTRRWPLREDAWCP